MTKMRDTEYYEYIDNNKYEIVHMCEWKEQVDAFIKFAMLMWMDNAALMDTAQTVRERLPSLEEKYSGR